MNQTIIKIELAKEMLYKMMLIREFEDAVGRYKNQGQIYGMAHCYNGQEAVAVGICQNLNRSDYIVSNHRPHGHAIAKGVDIRKMMAEIFGKSTGTNGGKGGSMHVNDKECGMIMATGIVGSGIPVACGAAFASQYKQDGKVTCVFMGDGSANEGVFSECLNISSKWNLPIVFVLEDNGLAVTTLTENTSACTNYTLLANVYGVDAEMVDGQDVEQMYSAGKRAIQKARKKNRPVLIQAKTIRFREHAEGEYYLKMRDSEYRDFARLEKNIKTNCPILRYKQILLERDYIVEQEVEDIQKRVYKEVQNSLEYARNSPDPKRKSAYENVFAEGKFV